MQYFNTNKLFLKMKSFLIVLFFCLQGQVSMGQSDSVYFGTDSKLIAEIQIINSDGVRERYTHFKSQYWLVEIDTVSMATIPQSDVPASKQQKIEYKKYGACDAAVNNVRNSAMYYSMMRSIDKIAEQAIGYDHKAFNQYKYAENNVMKSFSNKCQDEFELELSEFREQLIQEIQRLKADKVARLHTIVQDPNAMNENTIFAFLQTFNRCDTDYTALEHIILTKPNDFVAAINQLSEAEFFTFTLKLKTFPEGSDTSKMKATLKKADQNGKRKKAVCRAI